jgi:hypothetical protein
MKSANYLMHVGNFISGPSRTADIGHVTVVQDELAVIDVRVLIQVIDAVGVEQAGAAFDAMHGVAIF